MIKNAIYDVGTTWDIICFMKIGMSKVSKYPFHLPFYFINLYYIFLIILSLLRMIHALCSFCELLDWLEKLSNIEMFYLNNVLEQYLNINQQSIIYSVSSFDSPLCSVICHHEDELVKVLFVFLYLSLFMRGFYCYLTKFIIIFEMIIMWLRGRVVSSSQLQNHEWIPLLPSTPLYLSNTFLPFHLNCSGHRWRRLWVD